MRAKMPTLNTVSNSEKFVAMSRGITDKRTSTLPHCRPADGQTLQDTAESACTEAR
jgi:hypothetical protein